MDNPLLKRLNFKKIYRNDTRLYLTRYYLFRRYLSWLPRVYIHRFHASDEDLELHNHPWKFSASLILKGRYKEEYLDKNKKVQIRVLGPGSINLIPANKFHRLDLMTKDVWTIFVSGKRVQSWGFWDRDTDSYVDHRDHARRKSQEIDYPLSLSDMFDVK